MKFILPLMGIVGLSACATELSVAERIARADPAFNVTARGETVPVGSVNQDAADDPAIYRNPLQPDASLIVGTDKKAGLYVYDLSGKIRDFNDAGRLNNVDLRAGEIVNGQSAVLVAASDRTDPAAARIALFTLDPASARLTPVGTVPAGRGEAYGICLARFDGKLFAFMVLKDGVIHQVALDVAGPKPAATIVRTLKLKSQSEGCVVDEATRRLYVAEEDIGLWRFDADPDGDGTPSSVAMVDGRKLVEDAEGVALGLGPNQQRFILVSSQGDNAFTLYNRETEAFVGRFRIVAGNVGSVEETDGIDLVLGDFGPAFPGGLLVVQDGEQADGTQNFKLVAWDDVVQALATAPTTPK